jgi:hypothetical protein
MQKFPHFRALAVTLATAMLLAAGTASAHEYKAGDESPQWHGVVCLETAPQRVNRVAPNGAT